MYNNSLLSSLTNFRIPMKFFSLLSHPNPHPSAN
ncbi:MAG: CRISPR-associated protein Cas5 [Flavobacteriia bacterium]|nr:CRISPR-associated protein Cas5 [Flavobacteriia bacterium]